MKPTIGRTVHYLLSADDVVQINRRREDTQNNLARMREDKPGFQAHIGNLVNIGETVSMVITQVWPNEFGPDNDGVNGQVTLDGNDSLWVTSIKEGNAVGEWHWPERT